MSSRRCDHDPARPRLQLVIAVSEKLPKMLSDAMTGAESIYHYPATFPELTLAHEARGARVRRRRTSRLEAICLVVKALIRRCDRRTCRVGAQLANGLCFGVDRNQLCWQTGLTPSRLGRALEELEAAGYIRSYQPVEELDTPKPRPGRRPGTKGATQTHRAYPAVRWLSPLCFQRLGITAKKLKVNQARGAAEWAVKTGRPVSPTVLRALRRSRKALVARRGPPGAGRAPNGAELAEANDARRLAAISLQVREEHPEWGLERVRAEARRRLSPP